MDDVKLPDSIRDIYKDYLEETSALRGDLLDKAQEYWPALFEEISAHLDKWGVWDTIGGFEHTIGLDQSYYYNDETYSMWPDHIHFLEDGKFVSEYDIDRWDDSQFNDARNAIISILDKYQTEIKTLIGRGTIRLFKHNYEVELEE